MEIDMQKVEELILKIISFLQKTSFGASKTKIYKLMYFLDFGNYATTGSSITQLPYLKFKFGPVPLGIHTLLEAMEDNDLLRIKKVSDYYGNHLVYETQESANKYFKFDWQEQELSAIKKTLVYFKEFSASQISKESHHQYAWVCAKNAKIISYEDAKFADYEWLDYYHNKSKDDFQEDQKTRQILNENDEIDELMASIQKL